MKVRKGAVALWVLVVLGMVVVNGCSPVITVETPVPTPDVAAIVEATVATKTPVPTPDIAATVEAAVATALASQPAPDVAATVEAAVATKMAATQTAAATPISCVSPTIEFTNVPPYGHTYEDLEGRVACVEPADYGVAVYIYVDGGWYNKPYLDEPLTPIDDESDETSWTTDITLLESDSRATQIAAFLISNRCKLPEMKGDPTLPAELFESAVAHVMVDREPESRTIEFSGHAWKVKASETRVGPGPNYFSDREEDVWVDENGQLHMRIVFRDDRWYCTEVFTAEPLGYGNYTFTLASRVDQLDKNVVLGLFTWDDTAPEYNYREIDIEFSRRGEEEGDNSQFVVQPSHHAGNRHQFNMELREDYSTHSFDWSAASIQFSSFQGHKSPPSPSDQIKSWLYTGDDIPPQGEGNARINLWLLGGNPPSDRQEVEVIIEAFEFVPQSG